MREFTGDHAVPLGWEVLHPRKKHAVDAGLQATDRSLPIPAGVIDCLYRQAHSLIVFERQLAGGLEDAVRVDGVDCLGHWRLHSRVGRTARGRNSRLRF